LSYGTLNAYLKAISSAKEFNPEVRERLPERMRQKKADCTKRKTYSPLFLQKIVKQIYISGSMPDRQLTALLDISGSRQCCNSVRNRFVNRKRP